MYNVVDSETGQIVVTLDDRAMAQEMATYRNITESVYKYVVEVAAWSLSSLKASKFILVGVYRFYAHTVNGGCGVSLSMVNMRLDSRH
jgi:hypothetical protein